MFKKISFQKAAAVMITAVVSAAFIFAVITRFSYLHLSRSENEISRAKTQLSSEISNEYNTIYADVDYDSALAELEQNEYAFYAKCTGMQVCYNCVKYEMSVIKTVKGETDEAGRDIAVYQLACFDFSKSESKFFSPDNSLTLKEGKEYLIFENKRNYYKEYQKTLDKNEYSLALSSTFPTALIVNDSQSKYADISRIREFSDTEKLYYMCYNQETLNNINKISRLIIEHYNIT
ncbi:MAG: hypothetical protein LIO43_00295 [Clostridiales bacterium]|nr:hypothetical protein [Clostridiales bacterium]